MICTQWTHKIIGHVLRVRMQARAAEGFGRYLKKPDASGFPSLLRSRGGIALGRARVAGCILAGGGFVRRCR